MQERRQIGYWGVRLLVAFVLVSASGARAFGPVPPTPADLGCSLTQVTSTIAGGIFRPAMNAAGTRIAFRSTASLAGENPGEIFLFDITTNTFTQVTTGAGPAGPPTLRAVMNADGHRIAFSAIGNLTGANPDGNSEIFLFDTTTSTFTQVTNSLLPAGSIEPLISDSGTRIAFTSSGNLTAANPDGNFEVFLFDTTTSTLTQVTNTLSPASNFASAISNTRIALSSNGNLTGGNPDGNFEVFLFDTTTTTSIQITNTTGSAISSGASAISGTRIALSSNGNLTGGNPDGNSEVFLFDTTTTTFTQVTNTLSPASNFDAAIGGNGTRIAFSSNGNLTGANLDGNREIFLFDTTTTTFTQVTNTAGSAIFSASPTISDNGTRIAFPSNADVTGENPDGNVEVFLATCLEEDTTPPVITVSANPAILWPPNGRLVPVTISGTMMDEPGGSGVNASSAAYMVLDEYGQLQPRGSITLGANGRYTVTVWLEASRRGNDPDGRRYTIVVGAKDNAGNPAAASTIVTVPHDQGR